jgi:hypothetical protein
MEAKMSVTGAFEQSVDILRGRRYVNADPAVVLSREFIALMAAIEEKTPGLDGSILMEAMEEVSYRALKWIFLNAPEAGEDRKAMVEEYFRLSGLGRISVISAGEEGGRAEVTVTDGSEKSVTGSGVMGYLAGAFAAMTGRGLRSFSVTEDRGVGAGAYLIGLRS